MSDTIRPESVKPCKQNDKCRKNRRGIRQKQGACVIAVHQLSRRDREISWSRCDVVGSGAWKVANAVSGDLISDARCTNIIEPTLKKLSVAFMHPSIIKPSTINIPWHEIKRILNKRYINP